jgi:hypothetical protein
MDGSQVPPYEGYVPGLGEGDGDFGVGDEIAAAMFSNTSAFSNCVAAVWTLSLRQRTWSILPDT